MKSFCKSILVIGLVFLACCGPYKEERLKVSGVNSKFDFDISKPFEEYIDYSRKIIKSGRVDLNQDNEDKIISWNAPFILAPNGKNCTGDKKGILLVHGLSDSPINTRAMADYFSENCFIVYSILLTGHGTRPGDLLEVSYKEWVKQVEYGVKDLSTRVDKVYLGGFSTGGALAVDYILSHPAQDIEAVILLSPALKLDSLAALAPILKYFKKYLSVYEDKDLVKYESFATNAAKQIYLLTKLIERKLEDDSSKLKNVKIFTALSYEDKTIDPIGTLESILDNTAPNNRHIILYHKDDLPADIIKQQNLYPVKSVIEKDKIFNLAHTSIPNDPENIWYGRGGEYRNCLHYYDDREKNQDYDICMSSDDIYYGEIIEDNLSKGIVARLNYNPFIGELFTDLGKFLEID